MHFVKQFNINGVATKQVACIELKGAPNAATEGAVGVLGMDMTSPTHEVYRCVAVKGSVYTWELLSAGMSIISATITGEGGESKSFPYSALRVPNNYFIKPGDLILDRDGYLYQITTIGSENCETRYCGTHIGGMASGDKDYRLVVKDGKLQMVTESGAVISNLDYISSDEDTLHRDTATGKTSVRGVKTITDESLRMFVGTKAEYDALADEQKKSLFAIITDEDAAHQYHHTCRVTMTALNPSDYSVVGDFVFDISVTTSSETPPNMALYFYRDAGNARPWRGVGSKNGVEYNITSYTYNGYESNGYPKATVTFGGGGGTFSFVYEGVSTKTTTIELY